MPNIINADNGVISGVAGIKTSADTSGVLNIQTNGTTAISISTAQVVSLTNSPTFTGGTANGVLYLNGSKVATSGAALVFDGTNLGVGVTPSAWSGVGAALQVGLSAVIIGNSVNSSSFISNAYFDGTNYRYIGTGFAQRLALTSGAYSFQTAASGTAGSAITFTTGMTLDASGNLGIGTASPGARLEAYRNSSGEVARFTAAADGVRSLKFISSDNTGSGAVWTRDIDSAFAQHRWAKSGTPLMVLDESGNLGIGTASPSDILTLAGGASGSYGLTINNAKVGGGTKAIFQYDATNAIALVGGNTTNGLAFQTLTGGSLTTKATLNSSGNLGLGVTPSAWGSDYRAVELTAGAISSTTAGNTFMQVSNAAHYNGTQWIYKYTSIAPALYQQTLGQHRFLTAASGTAGNAISFTQAMTLDASGNLGIGTASPTVKMDVNGSGTIRGELAAILPSVVGSITARNTSTTGAELHIRPNSGKNGWLSFTEDSVADRWVLGTAAGNGSLIFGTGNPSGYTERARITSGGDFGIGTQAGTGTRTLTVQTNTSGDPTISLTAAGADAGSFWFERSTLRLYARASNTGGVYLASGGTSWTAVSDERKKDIIEPISNASEKVASLRAVVGKYKTDKDGVRRSFLIAQDVQAVFPEAIDASDENELGLSYTDTIPLLVAAIQEQQAMIEELKAKVTALESK